MHAYMNACAHVCLRANKLGRMRQSVSPLVRMRVHTCAVACVRARMRARLRGYYACGLEVSCTGVWVRDSVRACDEVFVRVSICFCVCVSSVCLCVLVSLCVVSWSTNVRPQVKIHNLE